MTVPNLENVRLAVVTYHGDSYLAVRRGSSRTSRWTVINGMGASTSLHIDDVKVVGFLPFIDPENMKMVDEAFAALEEIFDYEATQDRFVGFRELLRNWYAPPKEKAPPPDDPAIRLRGRSGHTWARIGRIWVNSTGQGGIHTWEHLREHESPLKKVGIVPAMSIKENTYTDKDGYLVDD